MIGRGIFVVLLSMVLFALVFLIAGLAGLIWTGSFERAALIGGVCGFAAAWLTNTTYIIGRRTERETRREAGNGEDGSDDYTNRQ
jgi:hypothetical protein